MSFLNPFFLIGAVVLAVPVLIHMVRREKSEIVPFSSLMFLLKVPKKSVRQQQLKNLLLMLMRLAIIALLVAAFMRPFMNQAAVQGIKLGSNRGYVMLLDNSNSMRYGANFERLKAEATKRIDAMRDSDRMSIIAFNDSATILATPTSDKGRLRAGIAALELSYGGTRYYDAFASADRILGGLGDDEKHLIMVSDFQRVGWNHTSHENIIGREVKAEMVPVGDEQSQNVGIDSVSVEATTFTRTYTGHIIARIHNYRKDGPVTVPVALMLGDTEIKRQSVTVPPNDIKTTEFTGFDLPVGASKGKIKIDLQDPLMVDNEFIFTLTRREKLNVLIVDTGLKGQSSFLEAALTAAAELPFAVKRVTAGDVTVDQLKGVNVVIINDVPRLPAPVLERLTALRKTSQGQFVILGKNSDVAWWNSVTSLPVKINRRIVVSKDRGQSSVAVSSLDRSHNIFKPFEKVGALSLNAGKFFSYVEVEPKPGASVLAKFDDGLPFVVESSNEDHGLLVVTSTTDAKNSLDWNDLPLKGAFLPFIDSVVQYLSRYTDSRGWYALGEGIPVVGTIESSSAAVIRPNGDRQSLGELTSGQQRFFSPDAPGFWEVRVGEDSRLIAADPPSNEGNLERMPPDDLLASVQREPGDALKSGSFFTEGTTDYGRRQMGWWYLLTVALLMGIGEIYMANKNQRSQARGR